jgi:hypothetical protein
VRTTLSIDEDVAALLDQEVRRSGAPFKTTVNRVLRLGLMAAHQGQRPKPFVLEPFDLSLPPGLSFDHVEELLDTLEGPERR